MWVGGWPKGDELPDELQFKQSHLAKIKEAKQVLEREAREDADGRRLGHQEKSEERPDRRGRPPKAPSEQPDRKAQRNFPILTPAS